MQCVISLFKLRPINSINDVSDVTRTLVITRPLLDATAVDELTKSL